mmetsp:Transcript_41041/g.103184  ORF Transcript_41041/g.103184 Transcript_41041/m.103184 type:complete len:305 (-) Transcript_41041:65-979(-)
MAKSRGKDPMSSMMDGEERGLLAGDGSKQPWGSPRRSYYSQRHVAGLAAGLLVFLLVGAPIIVVPAGHLAIVDFYGYVAKDTIPAGMHLKTLFASSHFFSLKTQLAEMTQDAPTNEGLIVELDVSILYHVQPDKVRDLYLTVGPKYYEVVMRPEITSSIRTLTARFNAKTLYSAGREELSLGLEKQLNDNLAPRGIIVEQALLRKLVLPKIVSGAIEEKLKAEQESQRMEFIITKEKQEADRKRIEAQGISDFQKIVSEGISPELLEWKGIEATERLAESSNAKVVVVGNSKNGLPLILGDGHK